jgi:hypothetical protein
VIGQFPFDAPSVFNFFESDYELPDTPVSKPDSEPEVDDAASTSVLAPESQVFTPQYITGYVNVMLAIISWGVSDSCDSHLSAGIRGAWREDGQWIQACPQGTLNWDAAVETEEGTLTELNLLLTGGRLSSGSLDTVRWAYRDGVKGQQVKSALGAFIMIPEFNTLGDTMPLPYPREEESAVVVTTLQPYKAFVHVYMTGGADTWNMIVPQDCGLYEEYANIRKDIALTPAELLQITTTGQNCSKFGIHQSLSVLKDLYDAGEASFVVNLGGLVEPTTRYKLRQREVRSCKSLYSHPDQTRGAWTLSCQDVGATARGFGGRIADALSLHMRSSTFTITGYGYL